MVRRGQTRAMHEHHENAAPTVNNPEMNRAKMLEAHHQQTQWLYWTVMLLGAWLILAPLTFGYGNQVAVPSGGRAVWLSVEWRVRLTNWNDVVSGILLLVLGFRSLKPNRPMSVWACCGVGIWLSLAPVLFWAPTAAAYLNDTLCGMLVMALTVLIGGMPQMLMYMKMGPDTPPGWSYNPSSRPQRALMIALGFAGLVTSRYLAAFQLGYITSVWDPFFGGSSARVLDSSVSQSWPVSDAALGAFAYTFEFLMGFMGSTSRWRTMPWMVTLYGILVIPLGLVHIALVVSQPVLVGAWCTPCLLAAAIMLPMLPLEGDEVVAMGQHLIAAKRRGERLWDVFWKGGSPGGATKDERSPDLMATGDQPAAVLRASVWGMSVPWTLALSTAAGVGLMAVPGLHQVPKGAANVFHLAGAMAITVAVVSMGEVFRLFRYLNVACGLALAVLPWSMGGTDFVASAVSTAAGVALALLALPRGSKRESYGSWDALVR
jgi:hypothetical protein